jgi:NAD(P)-dependent dehydrogenase (short-subunit alcohol dehydrogenase family)
MFPYSEHGSYTQYRSLQGRCVFITGGASGIGASLVEAFVEQNAKVAFVDIDETKAQELCCSLEEKGFARPWFTRCDVSDTASLLRSLQEAHIALGDFSVLINNAANDQRYESSTMTVLQWQQGMSVNLQPFFFAAQSVQPMMKKLGGGAIINISSINAYVGAENLACYSAAKAGVLGLTKALAADFGKHDIRVNAIVPGWVATPRQLEKWLSPEVEVEMMKRANLQKRLGAHDVAKLALFLASEDAAMITAQELVVDGGRR